MVADDDPETIRSVAISPEDAADAYAYTQENPGEAVLRITPPFHGRMRARIHVYRRDDAELTGAVHISPADVIEDEVLAAYPEFDATAGSEPSSESESAGQPAQRRKRHAETVETWQERAREALVDTVSLETAGGSRQVELKPLG